MMASAHQHSTINLAFAKNILCKSKTEFKLLYNHHSSFLFYEGRILLEYDYRNIVHQLHYYQHKIVCATYSAYFNIYFILKDDWKLYIYNRNLTLITTLPLDLQQYVLGIHFHDPTKSLIIAGIHWVEQIFFHFETNIKTVLFPSSLKFIITPYQKLKYQGRNQMNKGYKLIGDRLFLWEISNLYIYHIESGTIAIKYANITNKLNSIQDLLVYEDTYFLCGLKSGNVQVWRIHDNGVPVHTFESKSKVVSLHWDNHPHQFWSASVLTLDLWSLKDWSCIQSFSFKEDYQELQLIRPGYLLCQEDQFITLLKVECRQEQVIKGNSAKVISQSVQGDDVMFVFDNNSAINYEKGVIYPPPQSKAIQRIFHTPKAGVFLMLMQNGTIVRERIENETGIMEKCVRVGQIRDRSGHAIEQQITCVHFFQLTPPRFDAENNTKEIYLAEDEKKKDKEELVGLGLDNGQIIFVESEEMNRVHTRLSFNRERIVSLGEMQAKYVVSLDAEYQLKLIAFHDNKPNLLASINTFGCVHQLYYSHKRLYLASIKGDLQIFKMKRNEFVSHLNNDGNDHDGPILALQLLPHRVLTCGSDERIKLWSNRKVLLVQIQVEQQIYGACLIAGNQLLIALRESISMVRNQKLECTLEELREIHEKTKDLRGKPSSLVEYCEQYKEKRRRSSLLFQKNNYVEQQNLEYEPVKRSESLKPNRNSVISKPKSTETRISIANLEKKQEEQQQKKFVSQTLSYNVEEPKEKEKEKEKEKMMNQPRAQESFYITQNERPQSRKVTLSAIPRGEERSLSKIEAFSLNRLQSRKKQTRREMTLNRIIIKNLLKQEFDSNKRNKSYF